MKPRSRSWFGASIEEIRLDAGLVNALQRLFRLKMNNLPTS